MDDGLDTDAERCTGRSRLPAPLAAPRRRTPGSAACVVRDGEVVGEGATRAARAARTPRSTPRRRRRPRPGRHRVHHARAVLPPRPHAALRRRADRRGRRPGRRRRSRIPTRTWPVRASPAPRPPASTVDVGIGSDAAAGCSRPTCTTAAPDARSSCVKTAISLDGRTAAADGSSRWITGPAARADVHRAARRVAGRGRRRRHRARRPSHAHGARRRRSPSAPPLPRPARRPRPGARRRDRCSTADLAPTLVVTTDAVARRRRDAWQAAGAKVQAVPPAATASASTSRAALALLGRSRGAPGAGRGRCARCTARSLDAGLADRLVAYVAPASSSAPTAAPRSASPVPRPSPTRPGWQLVDVTRFGDDVRLDYEPASAGGARLMFTGIVEELGRVRSITPNAGGARLEIAATHGARRRRDRRVDRGERLLPHRGRARAKAGSPPTRSPRRSPAPTLGALAAGRSASTSSVRCDSPTASAATSSRATSTASARPARTPRCPTARRASRSPRRRPVLRYVVEKGSITVDGISLTVTARRRPTGSTFAVIPHTLAVTTLGTEEPAPPVNLEVDMVAKYVERFVTVSRREPEHGRSPRSRTRSPPSRAASSSSWSTTPTARTRATSSWRPRR